MRENVTDIRDARRILAHEVDRYTYRQVHSITHEVPYLRLQRASEKKQSLFQEFTINPPFQSVKDIFCLRVDRSVDPYRRISLHNMQIKVKNANPRKKVALRIYPLNNTVSEIRFWSDGSLIDMQRIKIKNLMGVHF